MTPTRAKKRKASPTKRKDRRSTRRSALVTAKADSNECELLLSWFRLLARRRGAWLQHLWVNEGSIDGRTGISHAELASLLADKDSPDAESAWSRGQEPVRTWLSEAENLQSRLDQLQDSRLARLAQIFGLEMQERQLVQLCAAVALDPQLARVCAYLQDYSQRTYMTEELATRLLGSGRSGVWLPEMNVYRWELIQRRELGVGEPVAVTCDPQIKEWLQGKSTLSEELVGFAKLVQPNGLSLSEWPVDETASWARKSLSQNGRSPLRVIISAPSGAGKKYFAEAVARKLGLPLILLNSDHVEESNWLSFFQAAQRQVFLDAAALAWTGELVSRRVWPTYQPSFPLQFLLCEPEVDPPPNADLIDLTIKLPMPEALTREVLWRDSSVAAGKWNASERRKLAQQHAAWPSDIKRAGLLGGDSPESAAIIVRETARSRLANLAQILECPFTPEDLVLPEGVKELLAAITFEAEERVQFWELDERRRLFPQGRGLVALFAGPSGTGKTMAAQVIAAQLTRDLCRVNIAQLVSKWVGETSKNIEQIMRVAGENDVVLLFDEADALFARRSTEIRDAHDRYANTDTAFLLQAIESYPGIAILSTNLKSNIDSAFTRRLRYLVEFPKPDDRLQRVMWTKFITGLADGQSAEELEPAIELLATTAEATGAQIKFAVLSAMFVARAEGKKLKARHLLIGIDRELAKEGRGVGPGEREMILRLDKENA